MFGPGAGRGGRLREIISAFRVKGATSPDRAMTTQELGLPPRFEEAMHRSLGATGIFVETGGRYYLDEARLKQVQDERMARGGMGGGGQRGTVASIRAARMVVGFAAVLLILVNIAFVRSLDVSFLVLSLLVIWLVISLYQILYFSKRRRRMSVGMGGGTVA